MTPNDLVQEVRSLFSLPDVAVRLNMLIESGEASVGELTDLVELDAGLTAATLKLANSAWYGLPSRVDTVSSAVMMIGQKSLRDLVLSASIIKTFRGIPDTLVDMHAFWDNSTTCGVIARELGSATHVHDQERLFIAGLLSAVGKLVFLARRPEQYRDVLAVAEQGDAAMVAVERRIFGFDYAELGATLLKSWKLPEMFQFLVSAHLAPTAAKAWPKEAAIIYAASDIAARICPAVQSRQPDASYVPAFEPEIWRQLDLEPQGLAEIIATSLVKTFEILEILNPRATMVY